MKKDPATERRVERAREKSELRLVLGGFDASLRRRHIVNRPTIISTLRRGLAPLLTREIDTLERKELVALIDALDAAGKPGAAQDLRKHARSLLEWAVTKGLTRYNVLAGLRRPRASRAERLEDARKGGRYPTTRSGLCGRQRAVGAFGGLLRMAMLTAMRRSELSGLKWSDVYDDRIVIAAERAKTGARHEIPLTVAMRAVLSTQPRTTSALVFPGRGGARMAGWSKLVAARESGKRRRFSAPRSPAHRADADVAARRRGGGRGAGDRPRPARAGRDLQQGLGLGGAGRRFRARQQSRRRCRHEVEGRRCASGT